MNRCFKPCVHAPFGVVPCSTSSVNVSDQHWQYCAPRSSSRLPFFRRLFIRLLSFFQKLFK